LAPAVRAVVAVVADRLGAAAHRQPAAHREPALLAEQHPAGTSWWRRVLLLAAVAALLRPVALEVPAVRPAAVAQAEVAAQLLVPELAASEILRSR
jgi:hypothetical protein